MKQFNKLRVLEGLGLVHRRFNYATLKFEESLKHRIWATVMGFLLSTAGLKYYASKFWPREDPIQLKIG